MANAETAATGVWKGSDTLSGLRYSQSMVANNELAFSFGLGEDRMRQGW